jgi:hypothetical protein
MKPRTQANRDRLTLAFVVSALWQASKFALSGDLDSYALTNTW